MTTVNDKPPEVSLSGPSVLQIAAERAGVDLAADPLSAARAEAMALEAKPRIIGPHACHAVACRTVVPPEQLMCKVHWFRVPPTLRKRVMANYTPGQCQNISRIKPAWVHAARQAIEHVLKLELPDLVRQLRLPEGYHGAQVQIERVGFSTLAIHQEGKPLLVGSLATGEVREVKKPDPPAANDADPALLAEDKPC